MLGHQLTPRPPSRWRRPRILRPTDAPPVIAQPVSAQSADNGFDWADAAIGALVASVVLILAAVAATIVRPRQTVQL